MTLSATGRAPKASFRLPQEMSDRLAAAASQWGCTPSEVIRYGLDLATDPSVLAAAVAIQLAGQDRVPA